MVFRTAMTPTWYVYHGIYSLFFLPWEKLMLALLCRTHTDIVERTLDTLNNWFYNNSCFPFIIVQVQSFCKISTFCYWLLVFLSTSSKCSLRQPNRGRDLGLWPGLVHFLIGLHLSVKKKKLATGLQKIFNFINFMDNQWQEAVFEKCKKAGKSSQQRKEICLWTTVETLFITFSNQVS